MLANEQFCDILEALLTRTFKLLCSSIWNTSWQPDIVFHIAFTKLANKLYELLCKIWQDNLDKQILSDFIIANIMSIKKELNQTVGTYTTLLFRP